MNNIEDEVTRNQLLRRAERHFDRHNFASLLELAAEVCLTSSPSFEYIEADESFETTLLRKLGTRGLGLALDAVSGELHYEPLISSTSSKNSDEYIGSFSPLRTPEFYDVGPDAEVQQKIGQFGDALLSEAYLSLGADVNTQIAAFRDAADVATQLRVLEWLDARIEAMSDAESFADKFYHPAFLSPRLLGTYPDHAFTPTCLGKSVLTASFIKRCGVPLLHAGAMKLMGEWDYSQIGSAADLLLQRPEIAPDSTVRQRLEDHAGRTYYSLEDDPGFHSGACVQLMDKTWYLVDPNFGSLNFTEEMSRSLSKAHSDIEQFRLMGVTVERVVQDKRMTVTEMGVNLLSEAELSWDDNEIESLISGVNPESLYPNLHDWSMRKLLAMRNHDDDFSDRMHTEFVQSFLDEDLLCIGDNKSTTLLESFDQVFNKYILWGMSRDEYVHRVAIDPAFKVRAVEDIRALPMLLFYSALSLSNDIHTEDDHRLYQMLEVGNVSQRVGSAVLSDFATYCGDDMSYAFWVSNWPSRIPITERFGPGQAEHMQSIEQNNLKWLDVTLRYTKQDGIVNLTSSSTEG